MKQALISIVLFFPGLVFASNKLCTNLLEVNSSNSSIAKRTDKTVELFGFLKTSPYKGSAWTEDISGRVKPPVYEYLDPLERSKRLQSLISHGADVNAVQFYLHPLRDFESMEILNQIRGLTFDQDREFYFNSDGTERVLFTFLSDQPRLQPWDSGINASTPLEQAVNSGNYSLANLLIDFGAKPNEKIAIKLVSQMKGTVEDIQWHQTVNRGVLPIPGEMASLAAPLLRRFFEFGISSDVAIKEFINPFYNSGYTIEETRPDVKTLVNDATQVLVRYLADPTGAKYWTQRQEALLRPAIKRLDPKLVESLFAAGFNLSRFLNEGSFSDERNFSIRPTPEQALRILTAYTIEYGEFAKKQAAAQEIAAILKRHFLLQSKELKQSQEKRERNARLSFRSFLGF